MMSLTRLTIWDPRTRATIQEMTSRSMAQGAAALTTLVGQPVEVRDIKVSGFQLSELAEILPDPEVEAVGVFIATEGDLQGRFLLLLSHAEALALASLMVGFAPSAAPDLDRLARSALGEVGNQLSALFVNSVSAATRRPCKLSPPAVLEDMAGALVDLWLTAGGRLEDYLLIIEATFLRAGKEACLHFLFIPEYTTLRTIARNEIF